MRLCCTIFRGALRFSSAGGSASVSDRPDRRKNHLYSGVLAKAAHDVWQIARYQPARFGGIFALALAGVERRLRLSGRRVEDLFSILCMSIIFGTMGGVAPGHTATLSSVSADSFTIIDGTSNTLLFGESSRASVCVQRVTGDIVDGTSNTILFGESGGFTLVDAILQAFGQVTGIVDGTSNTIFASETALTDFCLVNGRIDSAVSGPVPGKPIVIGDGAQLDLCLFSVGRLAPITDGISNTILQGETFCTNNLRLGSDAVIEASNGVSAPSAVPLPAAGWLLLGAISVFAALARRRRVRA